MRAYIKDQMRFMPAVKVRQSFKVEGRGYDISRNPTATPIVINNFNRLSYLRELVDALHERGYENLYVIDNASTYEPLLEYYEMKGLRVFYLDTNVGYLALWRTRVGESFTHNHYVYTDPDIVPVPECPADFIGVFHELLTVVPDAQKVGFGLRIDDIPDHNPLKQSVVEHESRFWQRPLAENLYAASIDTTFALYRPRATGGWWLPALRTAGEYMARHLPWYEDPARPDEELSFYARVIGAQTHWSDRASRTVDTWPPIDDLRPWLPHSTMFPAAEASNGT